MCLTQSESSESVVSLSLLLLLELSDLIVDERNYGETAAVDMDVLVVSPTFVAVVVPELCRTYEL